MGTIEQPFDKPNQTEIGLLPHSVVLQGLFVNCWQVNACKSIHAALNDLPVDAFRPDYHRVELVLSQLILILVGSDIAEAEEGYKHLPLNRRFQIKTADKRTPILKFKQSCLVRQHFEYARYLLKFVNSVETQPPNDSEAELVHINPTLADLLSKLHQLWFAWEFAGYFLQ